MATLNPLQLLSLLKNGNPQAVAEQIIQSNFPNDPTMQQLLQMGREGKTKEIEQFAQQYLGQRGYNLNTELNNLINAIKNG